MQAFCKSSRCQYNSGCYHVIKHTLFKFDGSHAEGIELLHGQRDPSARTAAHAPELHKQFEKLMAIILCLLGPHDVGVTAYPR